MFFFLTSWKFKGPTPPCRPSFQEIRPHQGFINHHDLGFGWFRRISNCFFVDVALDLHATQTRTPRYWCCFWYPYAVTASHNELIWIHQTLNGTESQRTPDQVSCYIELIRYAGLFSGCSGSDRWRFLGLNHPQFWYSKSKRTVIESLQRNRRLHTITIIPESLKKWSKVTWKGTIFWRNLYIFQPLIFRGHSSVFKGCISLHW